MTELGEHRISIKIGSILTRPANFAIDELHRDSAPSIAVLLRLELVLEMHDLPSARPLLWVIN